jgi:pentafunctional AROM polypeptide
MGVDKKNKGGAVKSVFLKDIGVMHMKPITRSVNLDLVRRVMAVQCQVIPKGKALHSRCLITDTFSNVPKLIISPPDVSTGPLSGVIRVPGSKSISNRALQMAAMGKGSCRLIGLLFSDDTQVMMDSLVQLGARFEFDKGGTEVIVHGTGGNFAHPKKQLYLSNAGTASRFLTSTVALVEGATTVVTGNKRMKERPIGPLVDALRAHGCIIDYQGTEGCLPLQIK